MRINPVYLSTTDIRMRLARDGETADYPGGHGGIKGSGFQFEPFPRLTRRLISEQPEGVKGAPLLGAGEANLSQTAALIGKTASSSDPN